MQTTRSSAYAAVFAATFLGLAACGNDLPDPEQPITLVVEETVPIWPLRHAASGWNLEFGTQLEAARSAGSGQVVRVWAGEAPCAHGDGAAYLGDPSIGLCTESVQEHVDAFFVARHEVGHILGLGHAEDTPLAVMAPQRPSERIPRFLPVDHALFADANPGFLGTGSCAVSHALGHAVRHVTSATAEDGAVYAVWADAAALRYARLDELTARPADPAGRISTGGLDVEWVLAEARGDALHAFWTADQRLFRATVDLPSGATRGWQRLDAVALPDASGELEGLAVTLQEDELWVLASGWFHLGWEPGRSASLQRIDASLGVPRPLSLESFETLGVSTLGGVRCFWDEARLAVAGGRLMLVAAEGSRLSAHELRGDRSVRRIGLDNGAVKRHLAACGTREGLVTAWVDASRGVELRRIDLEGGPGGRASVPLPGADWTVAGSLALASTEATLALVVSGGVESERAIHAALLDARTLALLKPWQRLSAPDRLPAVEPWVAPARSGRFVTGWRAMTGVEQGTARTRCFP